MVSVLSRHSDDAGPRLNVVAIGILLGAVGLALAAWNKDAFGAKNAADALKGIGFADATPSPDVLMEAPEIAENGAVVPIEITSRVAGTRSIAVVIDKNPFPLVAKFDFLEGAGGIPEPEIH